MTRSLTLVCAFALAFAIGCGEFRRGPYEPGGGDGGADTSATACGESLGGACNPYAQTGCASGQSCVMTLRADGAVSTYCAMSGAGALGARCALPESCAAGLVCVAGQCRKLCCASETNACSTSATGTTARCGIDIGVASAGVLACGVVCDWRASNCAGTATCVPFDADGRSTDCIAAGPVGEGSACRRLSDCGHGLLCVSDGSTGQLCRAICDTNADHCPFPFSCRQIADRPAGFGVCTW